MARTPRKLVEMPELRLTDEERKLVEMAHLRLSTENEHYVKLTDEGVNSGDEYVRCWGVDRRLTALWAHAYFTEIEREDNAFTIDAFVASRAGSFNHVVLCTSCDEAPRHAKCPTALAESIECSDIHTASFGVEFVASYPSKDNCAQYPSPLAKLYAALPIIHYVVTSGGGDGKEKALAPDAPFPEKLLPLVMEIEKAYKVSYDKMRRLVFDWLKANGYFDGLDEYIEQRKRIEEEKEQQRIKELAQQMLVRDIEKEIWDVHDKLQKAEKEISGHYQFIAMLVKQQRELTDTQRRLALGLDKENSKATELEAYLWGMRNVICFPDADDGDAVIHTTLRVDDDDREDVLSVATQDGSTWRSNSRAPGVIQAIIIRVFLRRDVTLHLYSRWHIENGGLDVMQKVSDVAHNKFHCAPNQHLVNRGCLGTAKSLIQSCNLERDLVGALQVALSVTRCWNVTDSIVTSDYFRWFKARMTALGDSCKCFELPDGRRVNTKEFVEDTKANIHKYQEELKCLGL